MKILTRAASIMIVCILSLGLTFSAFAQALPIPYYVIFANAFRNRVILAGYDDDSVYDLFIESVETQTDIDNLFITVPEATTSEIMTEVLTNVEDPDLPDETDDLVIGYVEFENLFNGKYFATGSAIRYTGQEYPAKIGVVVSGDIAGGGDGLGDGIVDIVDVAVMRSMIINGTADTLKDDNYLVFKAFDGNQYRDGVCDIVDIARTRALIVKK